MKRVEFEFSAKIKLLNIVEKGIEYFLLNLWKIDEDDIYWFMVGVHEVIVNAYLHGNKKDESLPIRVVLMLHGGEIIARISDKGDGFNENDIPDPTSPENLLKPSGRGILFTKNACDSLRFFREDNWFTVEIKKKVKEVQNA